MRPWSAVTLIVATIVRAALAGFGVWMIGAGRSAGWIAVILACLMTFTSRPGDYYEPSKSGAESAEQGAK